MPEIVAIRPTTLITASAVSLNVADVPASAAFLTSHFGFRQDMAADGYASLAREDAVTLDYRAMGLLWDRLREIRTPLRNG